jgi:hypothetical protein
MFIQSARYTPVERDCVRRRFLGPLEAGHGHDVASLVADRVVLRTGAGHQHVVARAVQGCADHAGHDVEDPVGRGREVDDLTEGVPSEDGDGHAVDQLSLTGGARDTSDTGGGERVVRAVDVTKGDAVGSEVNDLGHLKSPSEQVVVQRAFPLSFLFLTLSLE